MATLTTAEKKGFKAVQLTQMGRLAASYLAKPADAAGTAAAYKAMVLGKLAKLDGPHLRTRVNVTGVEWGKASVKVNYSRESDYDVDQRQAIEDTLRQGGGSWNDQITDVIAEGKSVKQRLTALEA